MSVLAATTAKSDASSSLLAPMLMIAKPNIVEIPSLSAQWEQARFRVVAQNAGEAARKLEAEHALNFEEACRAARQSFEEAAQKREDEAARAFEAELEQLHFREMETRAAMEAQERARWEAKKAALKALESPGEFELAHFPQSIADAKRFGLDPSKIAEAERVYRERAVAAFVTQRGDERLRQAAVLGKADKGEPSPAAQFVVRAVPLPLPVVVTTRVVSAVGGGAQQEDSSEKKHCPKKSRKGESSARDEEGEEEEERSTCAGSDQEEAFASRIASAAASDEGDDVAPEEMIVAF